MNHHASIAVVITDIIVHDKIADHLLNIYNGLNFLAGGEFFQRFNQAILVRFCNICLGIVPYVGVAVKIIVSVLQLYIGRPHSKPTAQVETAFSAIAAVKLSRRFKGLTITAAAAKA